MQKTSWSPIVALVDADYLDSIIFEYIVNFERIIGRRIGKADLCHWLDCISLDAGLRPGKNEIQTIFIHSKEKKGFENATPSDFSEELNGKAFSDNLGEFCLASVAVEELVSKPELFAQSLATVMTADEVKTVLIVGDMQEYADRVKQVLNSGQKKDVTLFVLEPMAMRGCQQEMLAYSLMSALGIDSGELPG